MLFTEQELQMNINPFSILDESVYLAEQETTIYPSMVPIVENNRLQAYVVDFNGIRQLSESSGLNYLDSIVAVAESDGVALDQVCVAIDEADLIESPELAQLGPIVVRPLSELDDEFQFCLEAVSAFMETEDEEFLDLLSEEVDTDALRRKFKQNIEDLYKSFSFNFDPPIISSDDSNGGGNGSHSKSGSGRSNGSGNVPPPKPTSGGSSSTALVPVKRIVVGEVPPLKYPKLPFGNQPSPLKPHFGGSNGSGNGSHSKSGSGRSNGSGNVPPPKPTSGGSSSTALVPVKRSGGGNGSHSKYPKLPFGNQPSPLKPHFGGSNGGGNVPPKSGSGGSLVPKSGSGGSHSKSGSGGSLVPKSGSSGSHSKPTSGGSLVPKSGSGGSLVPKSGSGGSLVPKSGSNGMSFGKKAAIGAGIAAAIGGGVLAYQHYKNKPKSVIAKRIAALRSIYQKFLRNAQANPEKAGIFKRMAAKILGVIDKLMSFLQRKADGR